MSNWYDCHRTCGECQKICMQCHKTCEEYQTDQSSRFYNQYRQDHAALTQWILGLHGNPSSSHPPHVNQYTHDPHSSQHAEYTNANPPHRQMREQQKHPSANRRSPPDSIKAARYSSTDDESSSSEESSSDASSSYSETSSDEMEDTKDEEEELLNPVVQEFEYVPSDRFGEIPNHGRRLMLNNRAEEEDREEWYYLLYGDQKNTVKAVETVIDLEFCRNCDLTQPFIWPVLPLRMNY